MIIIYLFGIIAAVAILSSIVPFAQYLYAHFVQHEPYSLRYYFSNELFDRHMQKDLGLNVVRVINNREDMKILWEEENKYKLP